MNMLNSFFASTIIINFYKFFNITVKKYKFLKNIYKHVRFLRENIDTTNFYFLNTASNE